MKFEEEMRKDWQDRKKSLEFYFNNGVEKSLVSDIAYSNSDLSFITKKGEDIKNKLEDQKGLLIQSLAFCLPKLSPLIEKIGCEPQEKQDNELELLRFGYSQIYTNSEGSQNEATDVQKLMREYNELFWKISYLKNDLKGINTIIQNIKDNKEYKLPINIATQIGF